MIYVEIEPVYSTETRRKKQRLPKSAKSFGMASDLKETKPDPRWLSLMEALNACQDPAMGRLRSTVSYLCVIFDFLWLCNNFLWFFSITMRCTYKNIVHWPGSWASFLFTGEMLLVTFKIWLFHYNSFVFEVLENIKTFPFLYS